MGDTSSDKITSLSPMIPSYASGRAHYREGRRSCLAAGRQNRSGEG
jgi:hypothetical protein